MSNARSPHRILVTDFRSGELDPNLNMRVDTKVYPSGAQSLLNCILYNTGAVARRPGTLRLIALSGRARLAKFEFDADERYVFAFRNNALEIYNENGVLQDSFSGSTDCPWSSTTMYEMTWTQIGNTMFICHQTWRPKVLKRTSLTTFTMEDFEFETVQDDRVVYQPYYKHEARSVKIKVSSTAVGTGVTVTADTAIFSADWVGDRVRIYGKEIELTGYTSTTVMTGTVHKVIEKELDPSPMKYTDGSGTIECTMANHGLANGTTVTIANVGDSNGITKNNANGNFTIAVIDDDRFTYTAGSGDTASDSGDGGGSTVKVRHTEFTSSWDEQAFSDRRGWPAAVTFHEDRLWFGGSTEIPFGMWSSHVGAYYTFSTEEGEDDTSVQFTLASQRFSAVRHLISARGLMAFTENNEYASEQGEGEPITPGGALMKAQTSYGIGNVPPIFFDNAVLFVQGNGKTIREFIYDLSSDSFVSNDITAAASHMISGPFAFDVMYGSSTRPEQYAIFVNDDGSVACFHSIRQEQLAAWTHWTTRDGDTIDSVVSLGDKVFFSVERDGTYWLERFELDDAEVLLDSAKLMSSGGATTSWNLGSGYASQTVSVIADGNYVGEFTANGSGVITLDAEASSIIAGFNYDVEIIPMPPDKELYDGPMTGERRRIAAVTFHFRNTVSCKVDGRRCLSANLITYSGGEAVVNLTPVPFTGKKRVSLFGYDRDPAWTLTQDEPTPLLLLGAVMEVSL